MFYYDHFPDISEYSEKIKNSVNWVEFINNKIFLSKRTYIINFFDTFVGFPHVTFDPHITSFDLMTNYPEVYLIFLESHVSLNELLLEMDGLENFNPRAKFLFILEELSSKYLPILRKFFIYNEQFMYKVENFTYVPIGKCLKGKLLLNTTFFPILHDTERLSTLNVSYPVKPPYTACPKCGRINRGIEFEILQIFEEHLGIRMNYEKLDTYTRMAEELVEISKVLTQN